MSESGEFGVPKNRFLGVWVKNFFYRTFQGKCQIHFRWHYVTDLAKDRLARSVYISLGTLVP